MKAESKKDGEWVSQRKAADLLGCNFQTLRNAIRLGDVHPNKKNRVNLAEVEAYFAEKHHTQIKTADLRAEKLSVEVAERTTKKQIAELELQKMQGKVHTDDECNISLGEILRLVWTEIKALPNRVQTSFPEVPNLEIVTRNHINEAADRIHAYAKTHTRIPLEEKPNDKAQGRPVCSQRRR